MYKRILQGLILAVIVTVSPMPTNASAYAQTAPADPAACNTCKKTLIDARWALRQQCMSAGGTESSCNGAKEADQPTCCHCTKSPAEDPNCWNVACETDCGWTNKCASQCNPAVPKLADGAACQTADQCVSNVCTASICVAATAASNVAKKARGEACGTDDECASEYCVAKEFPLLDVCD